MNASFFLWRILFYDIPIPNSGDSSLRFGMTIYSLDGGGKEAAI
jgi:hypothetical protein